MSNTINVTGTGGILEGNLGPANVDVNLDKALKFDGTNDFIDCGTDTDHDFTDHFTLACWAKNDNATTTGGDREHLIAKYEGSNGKRIFRLYLHGSTLRFGVGYNSGNSSVEITHSMTGLAEHWNHYAATFDGGVMKLYVNGVLVTNTDNSGTLTAIHANNAIELEIGAYQSGSHTWTGQIADVRIYNAVLTDANIQLLASKINTDKSLGAGTTNLKGYWKLNGEAASGGAIGSGTGFVPDESGTVNQGTLTNFSGTYWDYDAYSVDVYAGAYDSFSASTEVNGTFEITSGKVEGKAMTCLEFDGSADKITSTSFTMDHNGATYAVWVKKANATGNEDTLIGQASDANQHWLKIDTEGDIELRDYPLSLRCVEAVRDTNWHHIAVTLNGDTNGAIYVDGVAQTLEFNELTTNPTFDVHGIRGTIDDFHGKMRDSKFFDYALSAEQVASLYSGTYPQTPEHWWKMDDAGLHVTGEPYVEDYGTGTDSDGVRTGATWSNGTLNLDRGLYIKTNGVMSAPRGSLQISLDTGTYVVRNNSTVALPNNGSDAAVTGFAHNDGTVELGLNTYGHNQQIGDTGSHSVTFYNLDVLNSWYDTRGTVYVENVLDLTSYRLRLGVGSMAANYIIGKASATSQSTESKAGGLNTGGYITGGGGFSMGSAAVSSTIQGASTVYPTIFNLNSSGGNNFAFGVAASQTAYQPRESAYPLQLANLEYSDAWTTVDVGVPLYYKFIGDMKFGSTVTIANDINLDLNGQRVEFGGDFTSVGNVNGGGLIFAEGDYTDGNGSGNSFTSKTLVMDGGYCNPVQTTWQNIFLRSGTHTIGGVRTWTNTPLFVGGTTNFTSNNTWGNITVATGGTMNGNDDIITCSGDFTTSGGLIGQSCLSLDRDNTEYARSVNHADLDLFFNRNAMTAEMWFKTAYTGNNHQHLFNLKDNDGSPQVMQAYIEWSTNKINARIFTSGTTNTLVSQTQVRDGKWHHLALVYDGGTGEHSLYLDGKLEASETGSGGIYQATDCEFNIGTRWTLDQGYVEGEIDEVRLFAAAKTAAQIRADMFVAEGTNLTHFNSQADGSTDGLVGRWGCNDGSGSTLTCSNTNLNMTIKDHAAGPAAYSDAWAGAGKFDKGSSTVNMTGSDGKLYLGGVATAGGYGYMFHNLGLAPSGGTTTLTKVSQSSVRVYGLLTHNGGTYAQTGPMTTNILGSGTISAGATIPYICYWGSSTDVPTSNYNYFIANTGTVTFAGNCTFAGYWRTSSNKIIAGAFSHSVRQLVADSGGTFDLRNTTVTMTGTTSSTNLHDPNSTIVSGNTTIIGHANRTYWLSPAAAGHEIVGSVSNLNFQAGNDLTVVGSVTNCIGEGFRQWHHTTDTKQLLDADPIADIRLNRPSLDNANELQTGG